MEITAKGIGNLTPTLNQEIEIEIQQPSYDFISYIDAEKIVSYADSNEMLKLYERDGILHEFLKASGYLFSKA